MNALTVSVGYDDLLAITLPRMAAVFERICVVTTPEDHDTFLVAESRDNVFCHQTDAFTRGGATFNKGLAIEEGLEQLSRQGWICCIDADILLPNPTQFGKLEPGFLYGAKRKLCPDLRRWRESWQNWRVVRERELGGYLHVFHAEDPLLRERPWYGTDWRHAGGCDSAMEAKWPEDRHRHLPFQVVHLGPLCRNWWGRQTVRLDGRKPDGAIRSRELMQTMLNHRRQRDHDWERLPQEQETNP